MADKKPTEIASLGEFGLIDHLTDSFSVRNASTLRGVGDDAAVIAASAFGRLDFSYYPRIAAGETDIFTAAAIAAFALLSFLPFISEVKEEVRWRYCISKI